MCLPLRQNKPIQWYVEHSAQSRIPGTGETAAVEPLIPTVGPEVPVGKGRGRIVPYPSHVGIATYPGGLGRRKGTIGGVKVFAVAGVVLLVLSGLAFGYLDPILGAFAGIFGVTALAIAWFARDWDQHPSFEEREQERVHRRAAKRERTADARARDRERWEAHQAKKARKAAGSD
jgi:hypothetical protein